MFHILNFCWSNTKRFLSIFNCFWKVFLFWKISKNSKNCATLFWWLILAGHASCETLVTSLLRSSRDSLVSLYPSREKYLKRFLIFWVFSIFATQFGDLVMSGSSNRDQEIHFILYSSLKTLIVSHCLRECVICNIICPTLP